SCTNGSGCFLWNGTQWQQLLNTTSIPVSFVAPGSSAGVYEVRIAPSNTSVLYMMYSGYVFVSNNKGATWTQTTFAQVAEDPSDSYRTNGQKMAVDPGNAGVVYAGSPSNGLFVTTNGGTTWTSVGAVPTSLA